MLSGAAARAALQRLKDGDHNAVNQDHHPDGTVTITLSRHGEPEPARFRVRDLYGPNEETVDEEYQEPEEDEQ